jgi:two-component system, cell cycle sensor histidine kinase and response regulator CckA
MEETSATKELYSEISRLGLSVAGLKEFNGYLEHLLHMISDGLMMINKDGRITYVNKALEQIIGCRSSDILGSHFSDPRWHFRCIDETSAPEETVFQTVFNTGRDFTDKFCRMEFDEGRQRIFNITATIHHDLQGNMAGVAAIIRDATELSRVKAENQEIRNVYERLAQYADEAIFRVQAESGRIIYINDAAEKILDYSLDDYLSDRNVQAKVINENHLKTWIAAVGKTDGVKNVLKNIIIECTAKEGQTVIMEFTVIAVRNTEGDIAYFECLGRDITVRRFMEAELAKAQKLESIGLLAGGIAHDFNNIMTAVFGSLALAKMESIPGSPGYARLVSAEEHCMKAKALTRKLLMYSRGGSPQRKTASIATVVRDTVSFSLSGKNINCRFEFPDDLWPAQIDESQMHQVVHSLVSNAAEAMPQGGTIEVGAQNVDLTADQVPPLKAGHYIQWYVRDHGVGISQEHMKRIFDPYFTTKQMGSVKGMGLGLAICYSIVKSHEGMMTVKSTPAAGTTFTVYIPASHGEKDEQKPAAAEKEPATRKPKILLIDDEQILLDVTGSMLKHIGYDVETAKSHEDALEFYRQGKEAGSPFSLIIMDLTMRGDEGGEIAIRRWKAEHPEVKAVISSGYMNDPVIEEYWKYGFVGAMVKPYSLTELKNSLENILSGKDSERT